jgi:hypothetical protein
VEIRNQFDDHYLPPVLSNSGTIHTLMRGKKELNWFLTYSTSPDTNYRGKYH